MANKRYYWLKLKEDFYDNDTMQYLESLDNGYAYAYIYTKLCLKSLKNEGMLIRFVGNCLLPYDMKSLSKLLNMPIDTVKNAVEIFIKIGLIEQLDTGALYMCQINEMIGSESESAGRVRKHRALQQAGKTTALQCNNNVTGNVTTEIEKDKEIDKDIEKESKADKSAKPAKHKYGEFKNVKLTDDEVEKIKRDYPNMFDDIIVKLDEYKEQTGKKYKNDYLAIKKWVAESVKESKPVTYDRSNPYNTLDKPQINGSGEKQNFDFDSF